MKTKIINLALLLFAIGIAFNSCSTSPDAEELQKPYSYSDQYYEELRAYKSTMHERPLSFVWFADYSSSHSMGLRFLGLPDSLDICSLWGGIPSDVKDKKNTFYSPEAHKEMRYVQKVKGVKLTYVLFPSVSHLDWVMDHPAEERFQVFGDSLLRIVYDNDLDGIDLDYEINGDWMHGDNFVTLVEYMGQFIGPKGKDKNKLLCIDFYSHYPPAETEPYVDYFIRQAYTQGFTSHSATRLQSYYDKINSVPTEKFIVTENIGDHYATGGSPFTEADGNTISALGEGVRMHSLEGMARWNPTQGTKGGFGSFFAHRDYNNSPPYKYLRLGIQQQNPSGK